MSKVKDEMFTDQEPLDDNFPDPVYDAEDYVPQTPPAQWHKIDKIALALSKAQGDLSNVEKIHQGYQNRYRFADLGQVLDVIRPVFSKYGLAFTQFVEDAPDRRVAVTTMILHESGQTLQTTSSMAVHKQAGLSEAQAAGSVITYLRRYQITAMAGIAQEDTDGATEETPKTRTKTTASDTFQKPVPNPDKIRALLACESLQTLKEMWGKFDKSEHRLYEGVKNQRKEELEKLATIDDDIPQ